MLRQICQNEKGKRKRIEILQIFPYESIETLKTLEAKAFVKSCTMTLIIINIFLHDVKI